MDNEEYLVKEIDKRLREARRLRLEAEDLDKELTELRTKRLAEAMLK